MKRFVSFLMFGATALLAFPALAQQTQAPGPGGAGAAIGAALAIGLAAFGGGLGQGRAAAAALEGIARNPGAQNKIFTPMILGLALIESLVIYALIIAFLLLGKV